MSLMELSNWGGGGVIGKGKVEPKPKVKLGWEAAENAMPSLQIKYGMRKVAPLPSD